MWKLNNIPLNNQYILEETEREMKKKNVEINKNGGAWVA